MEFFSFLLCYLCSSKSYLFKNEAKYPPYHLIYYARYASYGAV